MVCVKKYSYASMFYIRSDLFTILTDLSLLVEDTEFVSYADENKIYMLMTSLHAYNSPSESNYYLIY